MSETISKTTFLQTVKSKLIRTKSTGDKSFEKSTFISRRLFFPRQITISMLGTEIIESKFNANIINENTYVRDNAILNIIKKKIGNKFVKDISKKDLQVFLNDQKNYSNSTITKIYQLLNQIFEEAIFRNIITKNPLRYVIKTKSSKTTKKISSLTIKEHKKFIRSLDNTKNKYIYLIAINTGMRCGEILALTPQDINFKEKIITINKTISRDKNSKPVLQSKLKTAAGFRTIPIESEVEKYLKQAIAEMRKNNNNLIFTKSDGGIINVSNINTQFKRICKNLKFRGNYNFHMLRHTYATRCIEAGMPAPVLQKLLGHTDISTTINTYTTIFNKYTDKEMKKLINYKKVNNLNLM